MHNQYFSPFTLRILLTGCIILFIGCSGCIQNTPINKEKISPVSTAMVTPVQAPGGTPGITPAGTYPPVVQLAVTSTQSMGSLVIWCPPFACSVYIDGSYAGDTPPVWGSFTKMVKSGFHDVKVTKIGFNDYSQNVYVPAGQPEIITANLSEKAYPYHTLHTSTATPTEPYPSP